jgi:hypothetical protein
MHFYLPENSWVYYIPLLLWRGQPSIHLFSIEQGHSVYWIHESSWPLNRIIISFVAFYDSPSDISENYEEMLTASVV